MEFNTFTVIVQGLTSILISYLFFVLIGHFAIKWNNEWKAGLIPIAVSLVLFAVGALSVLVPRLMQGIL